jgi:hypothetical protein
MVDIVHTLKEAIKKVLLMMKGKREVGKKTRRNEQAAVQDSLAELDALRAGFRVTQAEQDRADRKYSRAPVPAGSLRRAVKPFQHTGSLTINDLHHYTQRQGLGGYHIASADLDDAHTQIIIDLLDCLDELVSPELDRAKMEVDEVKFFERLARIERYLPDPEGKALVNHAMVEVWFQLKRWGPAWSHWTYIFERFLARSNVHLFLGSCFVVSSFHCFVISLFRCFVV